MPERMHARRPERVREEEIDETVEQELADAKNVDKLTEADELIDELDELLDEIDDVLEVNAQQIFDSYRQQSGQ